MSPRRSKTTIRCIGCDHDLRGLSAGVCTECGRAFDPSDRATYATVRRSARHVFVVRSAFVALFLSTAFVVASSRSQEFGPSLETIALHLLGVLVGFGPWMLLVSLIIQRARPAPHPIRRAVATIACVAVAVVVAAEAWCLPQEILFWQRTRHLAPNAPEVFEARWPPFSSSHLGYLPATRTWFGGD